MKRLYTLFFYSVLPVMGQQSVTFSDYLPAGPEQYCRKLFMLRDGVRGPFVSQIGGTIDVPYRSGTIRGLKLIGVPEIGEDGVAYSHHGGRVLWLIAFGMMGRGWGYAARDCQMTGPPEGWSFGALRDGQFLEMKTMNGVVDFRCAQISEGQKSLVHLSRVTLGPGRSTRPW